MTIKPSEAKIDLTYTINIQFLPRSRHTLPLQTLIC